jgi:methyltransferase
MSPPDVTPLAAAVIVFGLLAIEAQRAAANERRQLARGGIEPPGDVYAIMRVAYPAAFAVMLLEGWLRGSLPGWAVWIGAACFAAGKAIKWWAIVTLGPAWTFRVVVVPGAPLVRRGPYRFLRHPNYVGVVLELVGVAFAAHAAVSGPLATVLFGMLLKRRIRVEERALDSAARHPPCSL